MKRPLAGAGSIPLYNRACMLTQRSLFKLLLFGLFYGGSLSAQQSNAALNYSVIYTSPSPTAAIAGPFTPGSGGVLYAVAPLGGPDLNGSVVALIPPANGGQWTVTTLHEFTSKEGDFPYPGLVLGPDGSLYGSLFGDGPAGSGAVFRLIPPTTPGGAWTERTVYAFSASTGGLPVGDLIAGPHGQLYGVNAGDETGLHPTSIYQLTPPSQAGGAWTKTVLYGIGEGAAVDGGLSFGPDGVLYCDTGNSVFGLVLSGVGPNTTATPFPVYNLGADQLRSNAPVLALSSGALLLPTTGGTQWGQIIALTKPSAHRRTVEPDQRLHLQLDGWRQSGRTTYTRRER